MRLEKPKEVVKQMPASIPAPKTERPMRAALGRPRLVNVTKPFIGCKHRNYKEKKRSEPHRFQARIARRLPLPYTKISPESANDHCVLEGIGCILICRGLVNECLNGIRNHLLQKSPRQTSFAHPRAAIALSGSPIWRSN
jgi:hypothetical protein